MGIVTFGNTIGWTRQLVLHIPYVINRSVRSNSVVNGLQMYGASGNLRILRATQHFSIAKLLLLFNIKKRPTRNTENAKQNQGNKSQRARTDQKRGTILAPLCAAWAVLIAAFPPATPAPAGMVDMNLPKTISKIHPYRRRHTMHIF